MSITTLILKHFKKGKDMTALDVTILLKLSIPLCFAIWLGFIFKNQKILTQKTIMTSCGIPIGIMTVTLMVFLNIAFRNELIPNTGESTFNAFYYPLLIASTLFILVSTLFTVKFFKEAKELQNDVI